MEAHFKHQVLLIFVSFEIEPGCVGKVVEKAAGLKKFLRQIPVFQLLLFFYWWMRLAGFLFVSFHICHGTQSVGYATVGYYIETKMKEGS